MSGPTTCGFSNPNASATRMLKSPIAGGESSRCAALRVPETRQFDPHHVRVFGEPRPYRLEGEQVLGPRAQQQGVIASLVALGISDRKPVDDPELQLDRCVEPGGHDLPPYGLCPARSVNASQRLSARSDGPRIRHCTAELASPGRTPTPGARLGGELVPQSGVRVGRQDMIELTARADAELGEHLAEVVLDRAGTDEQPRADTGVRQAVTGQPRNLRLLGSRDSR